MTPGPMDDLGGLRPEQGPPLSVPIAFFSVASVAMGLGGIVLALSGSSALSNRYAPSTLVLVHLATLGFLGALMLGALYQMVPVLAGREVRWPRAAFLVLALFVLGTCSLLTGLYVGSPVALYLALLGLGSAFAIFLLQMTLALMRAPIRSRTVLGMKLVLLALLLVVSLATLLVLMKTQDAPSAWWRELWLAHVGLGLFVWVGGLIMVVSWQVIPMFYVTPRSPSWFERTGLVATILPLLMLPVLAVVSALAASPLLAVAPLSPGLGSEHLAWIFFPSVVVVLGAQALVWTWQISRRGRRRRDASLLFWRGASFTGPVCVASALHAWFTPDLRWPVAFGWMFLVGWAGLIAHGMVTRIVPFLVWFHRCSPFVGRVPVPPMRQIWPDVWVRRSFFLHVLVLLTGTTACVLEEGWTKDLTSRAAGALMLLLGAVLVFGIYRSMRQGLKQI